MQVTLEEPQPTLAEVIRTSRRFSASERLLLAKTLLDSLVSEEANSLDVKNDEKLESLPSLESLVAEIKATPASPAQIQRASKTIDQVMGEWDETPMDEPRVTQEEWEQSWWIARQEMKQRDQPHRPLEWVNQ